MGEGTPKDRALNESARLVGETLPDEGELSTVFDNAPVAMILVDQERRVRKANRAAIEFANRPVEEMIGFRGGEALRCLHALDDPAGCGFGPSCDECVVRHVVLDTFKTGKSYRQVEATLSFVREGLPREAHLLVSTTPITVAQSQLVLVSIEDVTEFKRAEEALRRGEERYALAQRVANIGSWDWDIQTGHLYWSDQIEPMFGFAPGEFAATYENFLQSVHPEDRQYVVGSVDACINEGADYDIEHRIVWPDGTVRWVSEAGDVIRDEEGRAIRMLGIVQDITERKRAEEERRWLAEFPRENPNPVLRVARDCTILYANEASSALLDSWGKKVGQCLSEEWYDLILGVLNSGSSEEVEAEVEGRTISLTFAPVTGTDYVNVYGLDITGRRRAEERLYLQDAALKAAANGIVITGDEGTILWANLAFTRLTGYTVEEVIGQNMRLLKSGRQEDAFYRDMWRTICAGQVWHGELVNRRKDGSLYTEEMTITPVRGEDGEISHFIAIKQDITGRVRLEASRVRAEEALRRYNAELEARNEELDAFAHTAAHDLKNPLGLLIGYADILAMEYADLPPEEVEKYVQAIARNGRRMGRIIDELLLLSGVRRAEVEMEPLNMEATVRESLQRQIDMIDSYHAEIVMPETWPPALGYGPWVEEVWANYVNNAIKYGGRPPRVELGAEKLPDGRVRFWVRDNGSGLAPEEKERLFRPFTRLDQAHTTGHGLGLSIVRRIVEKLGGEVGVESEEGHGSVFSFILPGVPESQQPS